MKVKDLKGILTGRVVVEVIENNGMRHGCWIFLSPDWYNWRIKSLMNCDVVSLYSDEDTPIQLVVRREKRETKDVN